MKKAMIVVMFVFAVAGLAMAQDWSSTVDVLGAHQNQGRGCAGCHAPHSGSFGSGHGGVADSGSYALWGQDASPLYGKTVAFGDNGRYVEVLPNGIASGSQEVGGILLCLSCHDGNLTQSNMMQNWSYEQQIGLLTNTTYGSQKIPTLLGNDGTGGWQLHQRSPGGPECHHQLGQRPGVRPTTPSPLPPARQYAQFVANYGWPALAPGKWSNPWGINGAGKPYVLCTTCHNQHVMTVYTSSASSPDRWRRRRKYYATFFFINGPYNPNLQGKLTAGQAASTTQFCRQCHFGEANEANNTNNIPTVFQ